MALADTLPSPAEVAETFARMREAVFAEDARHAETIGQAEAMIEDAEEERAALRRDYPMFFPDDRGPRGFRTGGRPNVEQMNKTLRAVEEHPRQTLKQLGRRLSYSHSWTQRILAEIDRTQGPLVDREKQGRSYVYWLSQQGKMTLNAGGVRD